MTTPHVQCARAISDPERWLGRQAHAARRYNDRPAVTVERRAVACGGHKWKGRAVDSLWMVGAAGVAGVVLALVLWRFRRERQADMGAVSRQWVAEHRLGEPSDRQR